MKRREVLSGMGAVAVARAALADEAKPSAHDHAEMMGGKNRSLIAAAHRCMAAADACHRALPDHARHRPGSAPGGEDFFSSRGRGNLVALARPTGWRLRVGWDRAGVRDRIEPIALQAL